MFGKNRLFVLLRHGATQTGKSCRKGKNNFSNKKFYLVFYLKKCNFFFASPQKNKHCLFLQKTMLAHEAVPAAKNVPEFFCCARTHYKATADFYSMNFPILSQRILLKNPSPFGSSESQIINPFPTMWSSGTKPQYRESSELWRLSPIIK